MSNEATVHLADLNAMSVHTDDLSVFHIFLVLRDHGVYMNVVYIWKWSSVLLMR